MRLLSIASGSSGNCIYAGDDRTHILLDTGISLKRTESALNAHGLSVSDISAICVTHEHSDHVRALGIFARRCGVPVYATPGTIDAILKDRTLGDFDKELLVPVQPGESFRVGELLVEPFPIWHDAAQPVGYRVGDGKKTLAVATDMGHYDESIVEALQGLSAVLIEANHDIRMLEAGPYPYYLKRRILGDRGHLCNENCGKLLCRILNDGMEHILLGHLSQENNYPDLAFEAVRCEIAADPCAFRPDDLDIRVASREAPSELLEL